MTAPIYFPGAFCDVAVWIDGRLLLVVANGPVVTCYLEGAPIWQQSAPEALLFLRGAVQGGMLLTIGQGHELGHAWLVNDRMVKDLGPTFGVQPVGIDACSAYVVRSATAYDRVSLVVQSLPSGAPGSSQGLSDVQPDGTLWWADQHRTLVFGGVTFTYPNVRESIDRRKVTVGQVDGGIMVNIGLRNTLVIPGAECYEPHVAVSSTGRVAICARTDKGAAYVATTIQELSA